MMASVAKIVEITEEDEDTETKLLSAWSWGKKALKEVDNDVDRAVDLVFEWSGTNSDCNEKIRRLGSRQAVIMARSQDARLIRNRMSREQKEKAGGDPDVSGLYAVAERNAATLYDLPIYGTGNLGEQTVETLEIALSLYLKTIKTQTHTANLIKLVIKSMGDFNGAVQDKLSLDDLMKLNIKADNK